MTDATTDATELMKPFIKAVGTGPLSNRHLTRPEARRALELILQGHATPLQAAAYFLGTRVQGESPDELLGFIDALHADATTIRPRVDHLVDIGTPYDGRHTSLCVTVGASLLAAAAGVPQLLHGSGEMPPKRGLPLAPVLDALGLPTRLAPADAQIQLEQHRFAYLDARDAAPRVYALLPIRDQIGVRTALSTVEKLYDLAHAPHHIVGVTHKPYVARFVGAMQGKGWARSLLVQGLEGTEDVPTDHATRVVVVTPHATDEFLLSPADLGLERAAHGALDTPPQPQAHARTLRRILEGDEHGPPQDAVLLNAALRIAVTRAPTGAGPLPLTAALDDARAALHNGAAAALLARLSATTHPA